MDLRQNSGASYKSVDIQKFRRATRDITFDVYIKLSEENYAHVFSRTTGLDYKRLAQYLHKGVKELYIRPEDEAAFQEYVSKSVEDIYRDPNLPQEAKLAVLINMTEQNMAEVFSHAGILEDSTEETKKVIRNYVKLMSDAPKTLSLMLRLAAHGEYLYYHAVSTSVFSMLLAKATSKVNRRMVEIVGLGGFLHDIGCTQIPSEITDSPKDLTPGEWKEMRSHTKIGLRMLENTANIPDEVRYIVYQHHEEPSGNGYPNGLKGNVIFYPAKIVAVADAFSALITKRPFRPAYRVEQAIHIIQSEVGKYDPELVELLAALFSNVAPGKKVA